MRVAIIGYGLAGRVFHGRLLAATAGFRVVAIVTGDEERRRAARSDFPQARVVADADDLWRHADDFDLVVIATNTGSHVELALRAIDARKPAVVDKPIATTADDARRLVVASDAQGVLIVPFHNRRWDSDFLTLRRVLADGELGDPLRFESRFDRWKPTPSAAAWREQLPAHEGGGVLLDLGPHLVDQALLGFGPATSVYGEVFSRRSGADDDVFIALTHESGVTSHLWANLLAGQPGPRMRLLGRRGTLVIDDPDGQEDALRAGTRAGDPDFGVEHESRWGRIVAGDASHSIARSRGAWTRFYVDLRECLQHSTPPPVDVMDAVHGLDVLDAARQSAQLRRVVTLSATS